VLRLYDNRIWSALAEFAWTSAVARMARCERCGSASPGDDCLCGLHAAYGAGHAIDLYLQQVRNRALVLVEGQGKVVLHERGWRAEQCVVHGVVELFAGNWIQHMQNVRVCKGLGLEDIVSLEDAVYMVQTHLLRTAETHEDW
jgi:hypothetical protein